MIISGICELFTIATVVPFLTVISDVDLALKFPLIPFLINSLDLETSKSIILLITSIFISAAIFTALIRVFTLWLSNKTSSAIGYELGCKAYFATIKQSYKVHLSRNSSEVINALTYCLNQTVVVINSFLNLILSTIIILFISIGFIIINPITGIVTITAFLSCYFLIGLNTRKRFIKNSALIVEANKKEIKLVQESLSSIRDIIINDNYDYYYQYFKKTDRILRKANFQSSFLSSFPRSTLDSVGIIFIAILASIYASNGYSESTIFTILGTIALSSQRLIPSIQLFYGNWSTINSRASSVLSFLELLEQPIPNKSNTNNLKKLKFNKSIKLKDVSFKYSDQQKFVLRNINIKIDKGQRIGIIGPTGSGKSTLTELIAGLIRPTQGSLSIDNLNLDSNNQKIIRNWQKNIATVPQFIYLSDNTISENIALGIEKEKIDFEKLKYVSEISSSSDFINKLDYKFNTNVGEKGIKLSGGERQRIAIARALYSEPDILIFDEATSSLDIRTEDEIMRNVNKLPSHMTIIIVAHRLATIRGCDVIYELHNGEIKNMYLGDDINKIIDSN